VAFPSASPDVRSFDELENVATPARAQFAAAFTRERGSDNGSTSQQRGCPP
jgi:hypothetical protein